MKQWCSKMSCKAGFQCNSLPCCQWIVPWFIEIWFLMNQYFENRKLWLEDYLKLYSLITFRTNCSESEDFFQLFMDLVTLEVTKSPSSFLNFISNNSWKICEWIFSKVHIFDLNCHLHKRKPVCMCVCVSRTKNPTLNCKSDHNYLASLHYLTWSYFLFITRQTSLFGESRASNMYNCLHLNNLS